MPYTPTPTLHQQYGLRGRHIDTMSPPQEILQRQDDMTLCKGLYYYCIIVLVFIGNHAMKFYGILNRMTMRFV